MSNQRTETVASVHGDLEVEVEDCDSCGTTTRVDETVPFTLGDTDDNSNPCREGVACPACIEDGPVTFPPPSVKRIAFYGLGTDDEGHSNWLNVFLMPIFLPILMFVALFEPNDELPNEVIGVVLVGWSIVLWALIGWGVMMLV